MKQVLRLYLAPILLMFLSVRFNSSSVAQDLKPPAGMIQGAVLKYDRDLRTNLQARERVAGAEITLEGKATVRQHPIPGLPHMDFSR